MIITGGIYNSRKISTPDYKNIKPTLSKTRQAIFNTLLSIMQPYNKTFLDMFAGSGIMSLEALSRGFDTILFEKDKKTALAIKSSFKSLNLSPNLFIGDSLKLLLTLPSPPDVIFIDPPYNSLLYDSSLYLISKYNIISPDGIIILEHPVSKSFNNNGFDLFKAKIYSDKQISFLRLI